MTPEDWHLVGFTLGMAALSTVVLIPPGLWLAWLLARRHWPGKSWVETVVALPLILPPVATGLILLKLFSRRGWLGAFLWETFGISVVFTWRGVVVALSLMSLPLFIRSARVAFSAVSRRHEQIAASLGASPTRVFWTVSIPLARRGLLAGVLLAFARALGEFGATVVLAGNIPDRTQTLALAIYQSVQMGDDSHAFRLMMVSLTLAFALAGASEWLSHRRDSHP
jgi:molybdate transport system permease protein